MRVFPGDRRARREIRPSVEVGTPLTHPRPRPQTPLRDRPNPADKKDDLVNANSDALKKTVARANQIFENGARAPEEYPARRGPVSRAANEPDPAPSPPPRASPRALPPASRGSRTPIVPPSPSHPRAVVKPREQLEDAGLVHDRPGWRGDGEAPRPEGLRGVRALGVRPPPRAQFAAGADPAANARADPGAFDWNVFGSAVSNRFLAAPACGFMNGPMDAGRAARASAAATAAAGRRRQPRRRRRHEGRPPDGPRGEADGPEAQGGEGQAARSESATTERKKPRTFLRTRSR